MECLRRLSVAKILATQSPCMVNETIMDGSIIPVIYEQALNSGQVQRVTFVNGSTHDGWRCVYSFIENKTGGPLVAGKRDLKAPWRGMAEVSRIV